MISLARYLILVRRQGMTRMVDCRPANEADVLRADVTPLVEALGAVVDLEGLDLGILVVHGMHDSPCLHCPSREVGAEEVSFPAPVTTTGPATWGDPIIPAPWYLEDE